MYIQIDGKQGEGKTTLALKISSYISLSKPVSCVLLCNAKISAKTISELLDKYETDVTLLEEATPEEIKQFKNAIEILSEKRRVFGIAILQYNPDEI